MDVDQPAVGGENGNAAAGVGEGIRGAATATGSSSGMDTSPTTEGVSVMAASGTVGSITTSVHPLVIMNISEHWTRNRAQNDGIAEAGECSGYWWSWLKVL